MQSRRDEFPTIRVTNISENTTEEDLKELFRPFGQTQRCYLATDRETGASHGFAFISFYRREEAQVAIDKIHSHGYDHLILNVEWAKPSTKDTAERKPFYQGSIS
jgi:translation initiation factor 3 subunit G